MFSVQMRRRINIILTLALLIAPGTHLILSVTGLADSVVASSAVPVANPSASRCGHASHNPQCIMSCWTAIVATVAALTVAILREPPHADVAAPPDSRHLLAATARGPPSA